MARVRLEVRPSGQGLPYYRSREEPRELVQLPVYRLFAQLVVLPRDADGATRPPDPLNNDWCPEAMIDTGAPFSAFPYQVWEPFAAEIWWLDQPLRDDGTRRRATVLGGSWAYRLGRVKFGMTDRSGRWLPAVWTTALFLDYYEQGPPVALVGLRTRHLVRRQLRSAGHIDDDAIPDWWLEDA